MIRYLYICAILGLTLAGPWSSAAVLLEDGGKSITRSSVNTIVSDAYALKNQRKVGVGWGVAGSSGLFGVQLDLNFSPEIGFLTGYGISKGFQSLSFEFRRFFPATSFAPFLGVGYARWSSRQKDKSVNESTPGFFAEKFLNSKERSTGNFVENLVYPTAGLQYMQLDGDWVGASIYAQVQFMVDIDDFVGAATGGLGFLYYF